MLSGQDHAQGRRPAVTRCERGNARRHVFANARRTGHSIKPFCRHQSARYAFSPDAFVKPKPTTHTAIETARTFNPNVSA